MRILFLSNVFPNPLQPHKGTFNQQMVQSLAEDHLVRVISPISWLDELSAKFKKQDRLERCDQQQSHGVLVDFPRFYYPPKFLRTHYDSFLWHSIKSTARRVMESFRPDVILSYWVHPDGTVAVRLGQEFGVPVVPITGGSDVLLLARQGKRRSKILGTLKDADAVLTVGGHLRTQLIQDGIPAEKIHVMRRGVNTSRFSPGDSLAAREELSLPAEIPVLLSVGRLVPVKALHVLVEACAKLKDAGEKFRCVLAGGGPLQDSLQHKIEQAGLDEFVSLIGSQDQHQLLNWYRAATLTVLPSLSEGVPNVLLESLACGTPFVASNVGGISEIADPEHDVLVPPNDVAALAAAIQTKLNSPAPTTPRKFVPQSHADAATELAELLGSVVENSRAKQSAHSSMPVSASLS